MENDQKMEAVITMGTKRKTKVREWNVNIDNQGTRKYITIYRVTVIWNDGRKEECIVNEEYYNRWIEGLNAKIVFSVENDGDRNSVDIERMEVVYVNGTVPAQVVQRYVNDTKNELTIFQKNNGMIEKSVKAAKGIIYAVVVLTAVIAASILLNSGVLETGNFNMEMVEQTLLSIQPLIIILLASVYFACYFKKKRVAKRRKMILVSIFIMCLVSTASYIWLKGEFIFWVIGYAALFAVYLIYCLVRGFHNEATHTVWKFEVTQIADRPDTGQKDIFLCCLNSDGEAKRYPYIRYRTNMRDKYHMNEIFCIEIKKITELNLFAGDPNFWFFDVSYIEEEEIKKSLTGRAMIMR